MIKHETESILESSTPLFFHCGLIRSDQTGIIETDIGQYVSEDNLHETIRKAVSDLEAELPRMAILKLEAGKIKVLRKEVDTFEESSSFRKIVDCNLSSEDKRLLQRIIDVQGGSFKRFGYFRFDLSLAKQNIFNCENCGEIWKSAREQPLRCPVCRQPQPPQPTHPPLENITPSRFQLEEDCFSLCSPCNMGGNITFPVERKSDNHFKQEMCLCKTGTVERIQGCEHNLEKSLWTLLRSYDSEYLNMVRSPSENDKIISLLNSVEDSIIHILDSDGCGSKVWTHSTRPIGNWPYTPWISFGIGDSIQRNGRFKSLHGDIAISCMIMLDAHSQYAVLAIAPNVKGLIKNYGQRWTMEFRPFKEEMRVRIASIANEGFQLDDEANYWTLPHSSGDKIREALVVYRYFSMDDLLELKVQEPLKVLMRAYAELLN